MANRKSESLYGINDQWPQYVKLNLWRITNLHAIICNYEASRRNIGDYFCDLFVGQDILDRAQKALSTEGKAHKDCSLS